MVKNLRWNLSIGASISIIPKEAWRRQLPKVPLEESQILKGNGLSLTGRNLDKAIKKPELKFNPRLGLIGF